MRLMAFKYMRLNEILRERRGSVDRALGLASVQRSGGNNQIKKTAI